MSQILLTIGPIFILLKQTKVVNLTCSAYLYYVFSYDLSDGT